MLSFDDDAESSYSIGASLDRQQVQCVDSIRQSDLDFIIKRVRVGSSVDEVFQVLNQDDVYNAVLLSHTLVDKLLRRFKDDWKSALGVFRWAGSCPGYEHTAEVYSMMVDILGKAKQMDQMRALLEEMNKHHFVTPDTVAKVMRRFAGAGQWEDAVRTFDELGTFGLEKNTETMNLLLDTLCKEYKVEHARDIFLALKSHIPPNAHTFNIFIHGWCKVNRVDEAHWTIQEMKGHGCRPCAISYSTIIQFYCRQYSYSKIYELLDEMQAQGCPPNVVTYTTIMCYLTKSQGLLEPIKQIRRICSSNCPIATLLLLCYITQFRKSLLTFTESRLLQVHCAIVPDMLNYESAISILCIYLFFEKHFKMLQKLDKKLVTPHIQEVFNLYVLFCFDDDHYLFGFQLSNFPSSILLCLGINGVALLLQGNCSVTLGMWVLLLLDSAVAPRVVTTQSFLEIVLIGAELTNMSYHCHGTQHYMWLLTRATWML
ncbi:hypothetical protein JRO89_XS05G0108200 [Xanthoceras sorbifolium]|uniref:Pentatricopeptide repeat-containing protein n=1 Tax=Xanthoceras sorbifolium TaxID=99658 RepID=A0ABQ8I1U8_9ROSI|nr:hypothetical protein JRO89_XS05G0108200 [Xanthoceras sorbifolium]